MSTPGDAPLDAQVQWIPCPGCAGEIGVPPHWLAHTVACPKCGAIVSISEVERVLWRPPGPKPKEERQQPVPASHATSAAPPIPPARQMATATASNIQTRGSSLKAAVGEIVDAMTWIAIIVVIMVTVAMAVASLVFVVLPSSNVPPPSGGTSLFGIEAEGNKFVYVFDRSASMGSGSGSALALAKRELLASLADLKDTDQFQIIFYNERPTAMNLGRQYGGLLFADRQNQDLAEKYVRGIMADGGTRRGEAMEAALRLSPDVIFLLTDADQPELAAARLAQIKRMNGGRTSIHTIEFGLGAQANRENYLSKIAHQNGGGYAYVDISTWPNR